jgi:uncharacterized membrane protein YkvA (DUF1232 family)
MSRKELTKSESRKVSRIESKGRMKGLLMFLPNMFTLLGRLIKDSRVPLAEKALFAGAIVYVIMPLDFIPDVIPFVGQIDDVYLVALTFLRLINRTDESQIQSRALRQNFFRKESRAFFHQKSSLRQPEKVCRKI